MRSSVTVWAPVLGWAGLIFVLSAQPDLRFASDPGLDFVVRKLGHMGVFGILALLAWRALAGTTAWRRAAMTGPAVLLGASITSDISDDIGARQRTVRFWVRLAAPRVTGVAVARLVPPNHWAA